MKHCPFCAELIQDAAVKCRYCGEWLDPNMRPQWSEPSPHGNGFAPHPTAASSYTGPGSVGGQPVTRGTHTSGTLSGPITRAGAPHRSAMSADAMAGDTLIVDEEPIGSRNVVAASRPRPMPVQESAVDTPPMVVPERIEEPASGSWPTPNWGDGTSTATRKSLDDVALRMQRIKASAAAVRQTLPHEASGWQAPHAAPRPIHNAGHLGLAATDIPPPPQMAVPAPVLTGDSGEMPREDGEPSFESLASARIRSSDLHSKPSLQVPTRAPMRAPGWDRRSDATPRQSQADLHVASNTPDGGENHQRREDHGVLLREVEPKEGPWRAAAFAALGVTTVMLAFFGSRYLHERDDAPAPLPPAASTVDAGAGGEQVAATPPAPPGWNEQLEHAKALYRDGSRSKLDEAEALLEAILKRSPDEAQALLLLAQVQLEKGNTTAALVAASRCTEVQHDLADCWLTIGVLQQERKNAAAANAAYEKYLLLAPNGQYAANVRKKLLEK